MMRVSWWAVVAAGIAGAAVAAECTAGDACGPPVATDIGVVQGRQTAQGTVVYHGIPFAAPPVGDLRWRPPQPAAAFDGVLQATAKHTCPQMDFTKGVVSGDEDCLYLSVYVPRRCTPAVPCAVMHWFYGGAWILGDNYQGGLYDGMTLAEKYGVVVVAGNYRVDALGFLALDDQRGESLDHAFGNYGIHDQRASLQWTQRNVAAFGGDANNVAIFGESAGGVSVCQHIVSPASNGLFSRAIMESGDCDGPWLMFPSEPARTWGDRFATYVGCPAGAGRMACLRGLPVGDVLVPYAQMFACGEMSAGAVNPWCDTAPTNGRWPVARPPMAPLVSFAAVIDGSDIGLPDTPVELMRKGKINRSPTGAPISVIFGTNRDELALFLVVLPLTIDGVSLPFKPDQLSLVGDHLASYHSNWGANESAQITRVYPAGDYKTGNVQMIRAGTDALFTCGTRRAARALAAHSIDVYLYEYAFKGSRYQDPAGLVCGITQELGCGVAHFNEVPYVFQHVDTPTASEQMMMDAMGAYWTNMAKTGTPNGDGLVVWPKYTAETDMHLTLEDPIAPASGLRDAQCTAWDGLPKAASFLE